MKNTFKNRNKRNFKLSSCRGFVWKKKEINELFTSNLIKKFRLNQLTANIFSTRGISEEKYENFVKPKIKNLLPNPSIIKDLDKSTDVIFSSIIKKKKIGIIGDYDVDGISSTALLCKFFDFLDHPYEIYIPSRTKEGYGPNTNALLELSNKNCELIMTLDCGTTATESINYIVDRGMQVIVVDHHQQADDIPKCLIINPNRIDDTSGLKNLAAVGVTFLLLVSINRKLNETNLGPKNKKINLLNYLDLVALGTICDVVPLDLLNRTFVKQGLKILNEMKNVGLKSLCSYLNLSIPIDEYHVGFVIGPKINASGRIGNALRGVDLLLSKNSTKAEIISDELNNLNLQRQKIESNVENQALGMINDTDKIICVSGVNWHPGVLGIVASKLTERFLKPSIVISKNTNLCFGSARSIGDFNIGEFISKAFSDGILEGGGGHQMAGGLQIKSENIALFQKYINSKNHNITLNKIKEFDEFIEVSILNMNFYNSIKILSPFGRNNPKPKFCLKNCFVKFPKLVGNNHVSCFLSDIYGNIVKAIAFKAHDNELGQNLFENNGKLLVIICSLNKNIWDGREEIQLIIEDLIVS